MRVDVLKVEAGIARKGMTYVEFAQAAGVSPNGLALVRRTGECMPRTAGRIANALGVDVGEIVEKEE